MHDEWAIALDLELLLSDAGAIVVGPVATVAEGLSLARSEALSAAVLDVRLSGETIEPVAAALADRVGFRLEVATIVRERLVLAEDIDA